MNTSRVNDKNRESMFPWMTQAYIYIFNETIWYCWTNKKLIIEVTHPRTPARPLPSLPLRWQAKLSDSTSSAMAQGTDNYTQLKAQSQVTSMLSDIVQWIAEPEDQDLLEKNALLRTPRRPEAEESVK